MTVLLYLTFSSNITECITPSLAFDLTRGNKHIITDANAAI
jgi:hypothetical protein